MEPRLKRSPSLLEAELLESPTWEHRKEQMAIAPFNPNESEKKPKIKPNSKVMHKINLFGISGGSKQDSSRLLNVLSN